MPNIKYIPIAKHQNPNVSDIEFEYYLGFVI